MSGPELVQVLILYGSETGNSQDAAEDIARSIYRYRFRSRVFAMDEYPLVSPFIRMLAHPLTMFKDRQIC